MIALKTNDRSGFATIGASGSLDVTLQNLINVLDLGMEPQASVDRPNFQGPFWGFDVHGPVNGESIKEVLDRDSRIR